MEAHQIDESVNKMANGLRRIATKNHCPDLLEDVLSSIWEKRHSIRNPQALGCIALRTAQRLASNQQRRRLREQRKLRASLVNRSIVAVEDASDECAANERNEILWKAVHALPTDDQELLLARVCERQSLSALGRHRNQPTYRVAKRLEMILKTLEREIQILSNDYSP